MTKKKATLNRRMTEHQWRRETQWQFEALEKGRQKERKRKRGKKVLAMRGEVCNIIAKKSGVWQDGDEGK